MMWRQQAGTKKRKDRGAIKGCLAAFLGITTVIILAVLIDSARIVTIKAISPDRTLTAIASCPSVTGKFLKLWRPSILYVYLIDNKTNRRIPITHMHAGDETLGDRIDLTPRKLAWSSDGKRLMFYYSAEIEPGSNISYEAFNVSSSPLAVQNIKGGNCCETRDDITCNYREDDDPCIQDGY